MASRSGPGDASYWDWHVLVAQLILQITHMEWLILNVIGKMELFTKMLIVCVYWRKVICLYSRTLFIQSKLGMCSYFWKCCASVISTNCLTAGGWDSPAALTKGDTSTAVRMQYRFALSCTCNAGKHREDIDLKVLRCWGFHPFRGWRRAAK